MISLPLYQPPGKENYSIVTVEVTKAVIKERVIVMESIVFKESSKIVAIALGIILNRLRLLFHHICLIRYFFGDFVRFLKLDLLVLYFNRSNLLV